MQVLDVCDINLVGMYRDAIQAAVDRMRRDVRTHYYWRPSHLQLTEFYTEHLQCK